MRIAVIGCGSIGRRHIANLLTLGERDILGCDNAAKTECFDAIGFDDLGLAVQIVRDVEDVWVWQPTCVLICTPPDSHIRLAAEARMHGVRGIFVEKPLALSRVLCADVMADCVTMVGCQWRWHPTFSAIKRWVDDGTVRQPATLHAIMAYDLRTRPNYRTCYAATTGAAMDVAWHLVDLALWLFGPAHLNRVKLTPADQIGLVCDGTAEIELRHDTGTTCRLLGDFGSGVTERSVSLVGADGEPDIKMLFEPTDQMYIDELRSFLACVREGRQTCNPLSEATKVLNLLLEAKAWAGR